MLLLFSVLFLVVCVICLLFACFLGLMFNVVCLLLIYLLLFSLRFGVYVV